MGLNIKKGIAFIQSVPSHTAQLVHAAHLTEIRVTRFDKQSSMYPVEIDQEIFSAVPFSADS